MNYVILEKHNGNYHYKEADTMEMCILGCFLANDVGCHFLPNGRFYSTFKQWAQDENPNHIIASGNVTGLEKNGDNILLDDLYSEQEDGGPYFAIPKKEFIRILEEWEQFCKTKPDEILITQDETGKITLEAKESSE